MIDVCERRDSEARWVIALQISIVILFIVNVKFIEIGRLVMLYICNKNHLQ